MHEIFKSYDVRGIYPEQLNEDRAYAIAQAYVRRFRPRNVALGHDVRTSSPSLCQAVADGLQDAGVDVIDIVSDLAELAPGKPALSTDMLYFAVGKYRYDGGIIVTASHNPPEYNGMKLVRKGPVAISADTGLLDLRDLVARGSRPLKRHPRGRRRRKKILREYVRQVCSFADPAHIKPLRIVVDGQFGMAVLVAREVLRELDVGVEVLAELHAEPDGRFPLGPPDPLLPRSRQEIAEAVQGSAERYGKPADLGVAWDADADRCFFFDEQGEFVPAYYTTALLAAAMLDRTAGDDAEIVLHDARLRWAIEETVRAHGGVPVCTKAGHAFIKERMRAEKALFAGESSGHYYFRDFFFADNGMIPFVVMLQYLSRQGRLCSEVVADLSARYPIAAEMNFHLARPDDRGDNIDGLSVDLGDWRFNLRASGTEPLLRLNVEARDEKLVQEKAEALAQALHDILGARRP